jgi:hypothetical protein
MNHDELIETMERYSGQWIGSALIHDAAGALRKLQAERDALQQQVDALKDALQRLYDADIAPRDGKHGKRWQDAMRAADAALTGREAG